MKYICDSCEKYPCSADETKLMLSCPAYSTKPKPITNADRIRAMTDEELAEAIKNPCDMGLHIPNEWCKKRNCGYQCSLDWLKQEGE